MTRLTIFAIFLILLTGAWSCSDAPKVDEATPAPTFVANTPITLDNRSITLTGWPLRTSNRSMVSVCVDGAVGFETTEQHRVTVQQALDDVLGSIPESLPELETWQVVEGCPPAPNLFLKDGVVRLDGLGPKVTEPSEHLLFVYFLPEDSEYILPDSGGLLQTTEQACVDYVCHAVTSGYYARSSADADQIKPGLLSALRFADANTNIDDFFLKVGERDHLSACVDQPGVGTPSRAEIEEYAALLDDTLRLLPAIPEVFAERRVVAGCPEPVATIGEPTSRFDTFGGFTKTPSEHRLFLYVLTERDYLATFGNEPFVLLSEEHVCHGDECEGVTIGLYISSSVAERDAWRYAMARALNVIYAQPQGELDIDLSACDRGEKPHPDFDCDQLEDFRRDVESLGTQIH